MNSISVIIPALNEAEYIERAIRSISDQAGARIKKEIIVVDCGSRDGTQQIARKLNARLIEVSFPRGRAFALNCGAALAIGDVFLFLDADTTLPQDYDVLIETALRDQKAIGGAFEFKLEGNQFGLRVVEFLNRVRYRIWPRYFGDQGIFVRKNIFQKVGGYPQIPIMEASHFCVAARRMGKLVLIKKHILTSSRRFLDGGIHKVLLRDIQIWLLDLIGFRTANFGVSYWK